MAQSARSFSALDGGAELPWSRDLGEIVDELAGELLPDHLLEPSREAREAEAAERAVRRENEAWLAGQTQEALAALDRPGRAAIVDEARKRFGAYATEAWRVEQLVREFETSHEADDGETRAS